MNPHGPDTHLETGHRPVGRFGRWVGRGATKLSRVRAALPFYPEGPSLSSAVATGLFILLVAGLPASYLLTRMNAALNPPVATFEGRPFAEWLVQLHDPDPDLRRAAGEALVRYGGPSMLVPELGGGPWNVRQSAADVLAGLGEPGAEALTGCLGDRERRRLAVPALVRMGPAALPALVAALDRSDDPGRGTAAALLGGLGPAAAPAVPKLVKLLAPQDDEGVRRAAAEALGQIGPAAREAVPALAPLLRDPDDGVRSAAFQALGRLGPAAAEAVPALIDALADPARRAPAAEALAAVGPAAVPALRTAAGGNDEAARAAAEAVRRRIEEEPSRQLSEPHP
jgi:HEAT repeat protein